MPARTRKSNQDVNFKVYYSKKVPKQIYFPHRRKTVREKPGMWQDVPEPRQMTFLPDKMRTGGIVRDSENEDETEEEASSSMELSREDHQGAGEGASGTRGDKKRNSDVMQRDSDEEDEGPVRPAPKRRRQLATKSKRRSLASNVNSVFDENEIPSHVPASPAESGRGRGSRLRKRQSTMTQLIDGRRPGLEDKEPEFKPIKKSPTMSWGKAGNKAKGKDRQQRTLTQMVPGLTPIGNISDEETEEEPEDDGAYNDALAEHLAQNGVFEPASGNGRVDGAGVDTGGLEDVETVNIEQQGVIQDNGFQINGAGADDDIDNDYQPTQNILIPTLERRRTRRRVSGKESSELTTTVKTKSTPQRAFKSKFGLLSTPERRKVYQIPSSQSPPESPLLTQASPRSPLKERPGNWQKPQDTPSKRKQVTFQDFVEEVQPKSVLPRRKFDNIIQDSEHEDEEFEEQTEDFVGGEDIGTETQAMIDRIEHPTWGRNIGTETQAILEQIDQACANAEEDVELHRRENLEPFGTQGPRVGHYEESQELGQHWNEDRMEHDATSPNLQRTHHYLAHSCIKEEPREDGMSTTTLPLELSRQQNRANPSISADMDSRFHDKDTNISSEDRRHEAHPEAPSSPTIIKDEPEDEDEAPLTPPYQPNLTRHSAPFEPTDLDGTPIQVARSPIPTNADTQETARSFSSRAERQLQSEWLSYSQYPRALPSSSMFVTLDASNYQATPFPDRALRAIAAPRWSAPLSQATTAADITQRSPIVTPRKSRIASANTTPRKVPNSQPVVSPQIPHTLVIPSSFPSPSIASYRGWSSPVLEEVETGEFGSIEDFSIPAPPPMEDDE